MISYYISHRGNVDGKQPHLENSPDYLIEALRLGYDVEIDVWLIDGDVYFGHDEPQYLINLGEWRKYSDKIWFHCKNHQALSKFVYDKVHNLSNIFHYFWHETDKYTLTSQGFVWMYPGVDMITFDSILVLPEREGIQSDSHIINQVSGICSDLILNYKTK